MYRQHARRTLTLTQTLNDIYQYNIHFEDVCSFFHLTDQVLKVIVNNFLRYSPWSQ